MPRPGVPEVVGVEYGPGPVAPRQGRRAPSAPRRPATSLSSATPDPGGLTTVRVLRGPPAAAVRTATWAARRRRAAGPRRCAGTPRRPGAAGLRRSRRAAGRPGRSGRPGWPAGRLMCSASWPCSCHALLQGSSETMTTYGSAAPEGAQRRRVEATSGYRPSASTRSGGARAPSASSTARRAPNAQATGPTARGCRPPAPLQVAVVPPDQVQAREETLRRRSSAAGQQPPAGATRWIGYAGVGTITVSPGSTSTHIRCARPSLAPIVLVTCVSGSSSTPKLRR